MTEYLCFTIAEIISDGLNICLPLSLTQYYLDGGRGVKEIILKESGLFKLDELNPVYGHFVCHFSDQVEVTLNASAEPEIQFSCGEGVVEKVNELIKSDALAKVRVGFELKEEI